MAGRPATFGTADGWRAVGDSVRARRQDLNLVGRDIESAGVSTSVLSLIENARRDRYETRLLRRLCTVLGWTSDSIDSILAGGKPEIITTPHHGSEERRPNANTSEGALPAGTRAASGVDLSGLPEEDQEMIRTQVRRLKRLHGVDTDE